MNSSQIESEFARLTFEQFLWIVFAILSFINIFGDQSEKDFLKTNNITFKITADKAFKFVLYITLLIYIYFFVRNYHNYKNSTLENQRLFAIKLLGSSFLIAGAICLIYFQTHQTSFIGSPAI